MYAPLIYDHGKVNVKGNKMKETKETEKTTEPAFKPVSALDCVDQKKLTESKTGRGFGNDSKSINDINTTYSHSAIEVCAGMF